MRSRAGSASALIAFFTNDPDVIGAGTEFPRIISWNSAATENVFTCSGMVQAIGTPKR